MKKLLYRLWFDDAGAVLSVELILLLSLLVFGVVPGMAALRDSINKGYTSVAAGVDQVADSVSANATATAAQKQRQEQTQTQSVVQQVVVYTGVPAP